MGVFAYRSVLNGFTTGIPEDGRIFAITERHRHEMLLFPMMPIRLATHTSKPKTGQQPAVGKLPRTAIRMISS